MGETTKTSMEEKEKEKEGQRTRSSRNDYQLAPKLAAWCPKATTITRPGTHARYSEVKQRSNLMATPRRKRKRQEDSLLFAANQALRTGWGVSHINELAAAAVFIILTVWGGGGRLHLTHRFKLLVGGILALCGERLVGVEFPTPRCCNSVACSRRAGLARRIQPESEEVAQQRVKIMRRPSRRGLTKAVQELLHRSREKCKTSRASNVPTPRIRSQCRTRAPVLRHPEAARV
ncbi:hypothetical protein C8J57DRAFT_1211243 [Mycena rebaudengoi]|nr:hypothetical protein C8J57DRAFT_1211243 [Mycena rebaudengoi]